MSWKLCSSPLDSRFVCCKVESGGGGGGQGDWGSVCVYASMSLRLCVAVSCLCLDLCRHVGVFVGVAWRIYFLISYSLLLPPSHFLSLTFLPLYLTNTGTHDADGTHDGCGQTMLAIGHGACWVGGVTMMRLRWADG